MCDGCKRSIFTQKYVCAQLKTERYANATSHATRECKSVLFYNPEFKNCLFILLFMYSILCYTM